MEHGDLQEALRRHKAWLSGEEGGKGAYLQGADLRGADLQGAYLRRAYLQGADLQGADLRRADLQGAYLRRADLQGAYLQGADLRGADLQGAKRHSGVEVKIERVLLCAADVGGYAALGYVGQDGRTYLEYGCETKQRTVGEWQAEMDKLCRAHGEPAHGDKVLRPLIGFLSSLREVEK